LGANDWQKSSYTIMKPTERELQIGERLRQFRESKMIPRTRMAVALKIGNERLASYESGRAPLQYSIFREIMRQFGLSPYWLATGDAQPTGPAIDDSEWVKTLRRRARFSEVYDKHIKRKVESKGFDSTHKVNKLAAEISALANMPPAFWKSVSPAVRAEFRAAIEGVLAQELASGGEKARSKKA
jgi:transcriptional regulator with XRE-family HTH domain